MIKEWLVVGITDFDKNKFIPIKNQVFVKPDGGLWASPYTPNSEYKSKWHAFISEEMTSKSSENGMVFNFEDNTRIYTIDSQADLIRLMYKYGSTSLFSSYLFPDFENISKYFDVLYLTDKGQWDTRLPMKNSKYNLYGWDVECCLVLNSDVIKKVANIKF